MPKLDKIRPVLQPPTANAREEWLTALSDRSDSVFDRRESAKRLGECEANAAMAVLLEIVADKKED